LYRQGKVGHLLVSGDNSRKDYDEPTAMRDALVALGVPGDRVVLDYAGFSTLDSVVRARDVFGQNQLLIVSQKDHVMRAIYIARAKGMDAIGVSAEDVGFGVGLRTDCREALARVRTVLDVWVWGRTPKFLGPRVEIPVRG
jgi:SanA protein